MGFSEENRESDLFTNDPPTQTRKKLLPGWLVGLLPDNNQNSPTAMLSCSAKTFMTQENENCQVKFANENVKPAFKVVNFIGSKIQNRSLLKLPVFCKVFYMNTIMDSTYLLYPFIIWTIQKPDKLTKLIC